MLERQPDFASLKVLGLGDNVVDRYLHEGVMYPGGNALNFAVYAKLLGADASFVGTFGTDAGARHVRDVLAQLRIPTLYSRIVEGEGGHADVHLKGGNRQFLRSNSGGVARTYPPILNAEALRAISGQQFVHTSCFSHMDDRLAELRAAAPLLGYDLSNRWNDTSRLALVAASVDLLVLSLGESGEHQAAALTEHLASRGCPLAIMTLGAEGALIWSVKSGHIHVPPRPAQIVDTLGAGDAFATAVTLKLLASKWRRGSSPNDQAIADAGSFASRIAASVCGVHGAFGHGVALT
jgi:fructoselysine 6-kinase